MWGKVELTTFIRGKPRRLREESNKSSHGRSRSELGAALETAGVGQGPATAALPPE